MKNRFLEFKLMLLLGVLFIFPSNLLAQISSKQKSALGVCKSSHIYANNTIIQQNIGQNGIVGCISSKKYDVIQGYIFPQLDNKNIKKTIATDISVYAIANSNRFLIKTTQNIHIESWSLYSISGQKLMHQNYNQETQITVDLHSKVPGCYIMRVQTNMGNRNIKIIR